MHAHDGALSRQHQTRRLGLVIGLTLAVLLVEVAGGLLSHSLALLSDAGHVLTDLLALVLSLMAVRFASLPANAAKTYGYHRLEILTALGNGALLIGVSGYLFYESLRRVAAPRPIEESTMIGAAVLGLAANLVSLRLLSDHGHNLNIRGARLHVLGDALSSGGVVVTAIVMALTSWWRLDPLVAAALSVGIAAGAWRVVREAIDVLLEGTPRGLSLEEVRAALLGLQGVAEVHDLHVWCITTGLPALSGHVRQAPEAVPEGLLLERINEMLRSRFGITHTTIQIEAAASRDICALH
jgi:cobalt-zinc-cadmium efflux system protein